MTRRVHEPILVGPVVVVMAVNYLSVGVRRYVIRVMNSVEAFAGVLELVVQT